MKPSRTVRTIIRVPLNKLISALSGASAKLGGETVEMATKLKDYIYEFYSFKRNELKPFWEEVETFRYDIESQLYSMVKFGKSIYKRLEINYDKFSSFNSFDWNC